MTTGSTLKEACLKAKNNDFYWDDNVVIMQFTGLHDKNGKEIYEGDIVRILYTDWASKDSNDTRTLEQYKNDIAFIGSIVFYRDRFCVESKSNKYGDTGHSSILSGEHGFIEIIGNIYEQCELLNYIFKS